MNTDDLVRRYFPAQIVQAAGDYDASDNLIYQGFSKAATATSEASWLLVKHSYDVSNRWTGAKVYVGGTWDDRASYTFP